MERSNIIRAVMEKAYQISPEAVELIYSSDTPEDLLEYVLSTVNDSVIVIGIEDIDLQGFAVSRKASKLIYTGNKECPDFETSSELELISPSEPVTFPDPDSIIVNPDPAVESSQNPVSDAISVPDVIPGSVRNMDYEPVPGTPPDTFKSEEVPPSYLVSNSPSAAKTAPPIFSSSSSQAINSLASSFFGQENSLPSPSNRIFREELSSSTPGSGLFSDSRNEYKSYPGRNPVTVISDITGHSTCVGEYMQFVQYFRDRYSRLSEIIRGRINARPIESLKRRNFRRGGDRNSEEISIIGMVSDISNTTNGHKILSLEDPTGSFSVLIRNSDKELFEQASRVLLDEVIGVTGSVTNDGSLMLATKLIQPDVPNNIQRRTGSHGKAVLISDVHVGSSQFLEDAWLDFLDFLKGESDLESMRELAASIRYVVVAGDLVDGIGIYPDQEMELDILNVYEQYRKAADYIREIPEHIRVIISPGNHDAVRQAEPQPALPESIQADFPENVIFVGNPALVELDGVQILIYHGRSIDDLVASIPGVSYQEPAGAVLEMLKRRHLAPTYGSRVSISPEKKDYFIIDPVPDIIHTGHVHTLGVQRYKNVLLVNSGTWQDQTEFQKRVNLAPVPARVPIVDLENFDVKILAFD
ncbi:MAG: DNA-directed DNA polymerase II small subunit [Methanosarcina flavescens]|jgi:DNA polymerase II small subunit|uniref:DNA polymerase II small subunit n=1 Tax=Methanosarcina flavescens TaxID=1715806 RepID=A0A660HSH4_9EURY|nr:DNA-directed DNA polymerase II small subunit [Methanosarcina flavescens]AYK15228.1 DNA-directed DNA polymerase II small subunit [Methanosarcina flavescens]NLK31988.1 DNA-directed DNA polymerase II small subunit [Methanosarcina flavescens]